jgi:hypothetical protein
MGSREEPRAAQKKRLSADEGVQCRGVRRHVLPVSVSYHDRQLNRDLTGTLLTAVRVVRRGRASSPARPSQAGAAVGGVGAPATSCAAAPCQAVDAYRNAVYAGSKTAVAPNNDTACIINFGSTDTEAAIVSYERQVYQTPPEETLQGGVFLACASTSASRTIQASCPS